MELQVKVVPNAKKQRIVKEERLWRVYLTAPAVDGKANKALIDLLANHRKVKKSAVSIIKG